MNTNTTVKGKAKTGKAAQVVAQEQTKKEKPDMKFMNIKYYDGVQHYEVLRVTGPCEIRMHEITDREDGKIKDSKLEIEVLKGEGDDLNLVRVYRLYKTNDTKRFWGRPVPVAKQADAVDVA